MLYKKLNFNKAKNAILNKQSNKYVQIYSCTDSTNLRAKDEAKKSKNGKVFLAYKQTLGRGRMGRSFFSEDGVYFSILLKPKLKIKNISFITLVCAVSVFNVIYKYCKNTKIKWPNDIFIDNKKVCGILTEMFFDYKNKPNIIVGIGINTNTKKFPDEISNIVTSLYNETNAYINNTEFICDILDEFAKYYNIFISGKSDIIIKEYRAHCLNLGQNIFAKKNNEPINGKIIDINELGELVVKSDSNKIITLNSGEVTFHSRKI